MNYLRITNDGLICAEDLMLIGSSTKRDQVGKIGMFGSGWKYALAWLIRNECTPIIYSGEDRIDVDFEIQMHRANPVRVITVQGQKTSLTVDMGPKWSGWMAMREIISNAIDEGGHQTRSEWNPVFYGEPNKTAIYVPLNSELSTVMLNFDKYFGFDRKENYKNKVGRVFIKTEPSFITVYRKGIRCMESSSKSLLDFDFDNIDINEDRLCSGYAVELEVRKMVEICEDAQFLKHILREQNADNLPFDMSETHIAMIKQLADAGEKFTTPTIKNLGGTFFSGEGALMLRDSWYDKLRNLKIIQSGFSLLGDNITFFRTDEKDVTSVRKKLLEFNLDMEIRSGKCNVPAFFKNGIGYVSDTTNESDAQLASRILAKIPKVYWRSLLGEKEDAQAESNKSDDLLF